MQAWLPTMLALAAIWGCSFLFISVGVRELHPLYLALGRVLAGSLVLLVDPGGQARVAAPRSRGCGLHSFVVGAIGSAIPWTLFGYGEQRIPSLLAGIWNGITPLVVLPIAVLIFRTETFSLQRVLGLVVGFAGMLVVLGAWNVQGGADLTGQVLCMLAAVSYGFAIPYQKRFIAGTTLSGTALSAELADLRNGPARGGRADRHPAGAAGAVVAVDRGGRQRARARCARAAGSRSCSACATSG